MKFRIGIAHILTFLLYFHACAITIDTASTNILYSSIADGMNSWRMVEGSCEEIELGTRLHSNSRMHLELENKHAITNVSLHIDFYPPRIDRASMLLRLKDNDCYCALTVLAGRLGIEISERWIRAFALDKKHRHTDTVFAHVDMEMHPDGTEKILCISIKDNMAEVLVNGQSMLVTTVHHHDFRNIRIDSYNHSFILAGIVLYSLEPEPLIVNRDSSYVDARAEYFPSRFNSSRGIKNHHFVAAESGRAHPHALFTTFASARRMHDALRAAGAQPGNNLTRHTWTKRRSKRSTEPDKKAEGTPVELEIHFGDSIYSPRDVIRDMRGQKYEFRFAGNAEHIAHWRSGGIVCLQSCPGGVIGNRAYSIRDLVDGEARFSPQSKLPFFEGEKVTIRFLIQKD